MCWEDTGSRPKVRLTAAQKMSIRQINSVVWESIRSDTEHIIVKLCNVSALSYLEMHNFPPLFPYFAHYPQVKSESVNRSVMSDCSQPHGLEPSRLLCPWNSPGKNPGVDCHFLLQGIFLTQGSNLGLLCCRHVLYHLSHQGKWLVTNRKTVQLPNYLLFKILKAYKLNLQMFVQKQCGILKICVWRTAVTVQWLKLCLPRQRVWVWSLVGELSPHIPHSQKTKT